MNTVNMNYANHHFLSNNWFKAVAPTHQTAHWKLILYTIINWIFLQIWNPFYNHYGAPCKSQSTKVYRAIPLCFSVQAKGG